MNTCGTCKHLGDEVSDYHDGDYGPTGYHKCNLIDLDRKEQKVPPVLAYAQDGSDYVAVLCVRTEFGCVEWTAREPRSVED
jgi:hypothetical protein